MGRPAWQAPVASFKRKEINILRLWQVIAATIIFKSADFAFTAAFLLPPSYKFPPIAFLGCWLFGSILVWLIGGFFAGEWGHPKDVDWGDGLSRIPRPPAPPAKDD